MKRLLVLTILCLPSVIYAAPLGVDSVVVDSFYSDIPELGGVKTTTRLPTGGDNWTDKSRTASSDDQYCYDAKLAGSGFGDSLYISEFAFSIPSQYHVSRARLKVEGYSPVEEVGLSACLTADNTTDLTDWMVEAMPTSDDSMFFDWTGYFGHYFVNTSTFGVKLKRDTLTALDTIFIDYIELTLWIATEDDSVVISVATFNESWNDAIVILAKSFDTDTLYPGIDDYDWRWSYPHPGDSTGIADTVVVEFHETTDRYLQVAAYTWDEDSGTSDLSYYSIFFNSGLVQPLYPYGNSGKKSGSAASGTNWTNPTYVYAADNFRATYNNAGQNWLTVTGFNVAMPANGTPVGFLLDTEGYSSSSTVSRRIFHASIVNGGSVVGTVRLDTLPQTTEAITSTPPTGASTNLWGTSGITAANVNASNFGIAIRDANTTAHLLNFDHLQLTVYYTYPDSLLSAQASLWRRDYSGQNDSIWFIATTTTSNIEDHVKICYNTTAAYPDSSDADSIVYAYEAAKTTYNYITVDKTEPCTISVCFWVRDGLGYSARQQRQLIYDDEDSGVLYQGPNYPTIAAPEGGWTLEDSGRYCDDYYATWLEGDAGSLILTGYGFTVPSNSHIDSITTDVQLYTVLNGGENADIQISVGAGSKNTFFVMASQWPVDAEAAVHGESDSVTGSWNPNFVPANIDSTEFGVAISANLTTNNEDSFVDCIPLTVWYHLVAESEDLFYIQHRIILDCLKR